MAVTLLRVCELQFFCWFLPLRLFTGFCDCFRVRIACTSLYSLLFFHFSFPVLPFGSEQANDTQQQRWHQKAKRKRRRKRSCQAAKSCATAKSCGNSGLLVWFLILRVVPWCWWLLLYLHRFWLYCACVFVCLLIFRVFHVFLLCFVFRAFACSLWMGCALCWVSGAPSRRTRTCFEVPVCVLSFSSCLFVVARFLLLFVVIVRVCVDCVECEVVFRGYGFPFGFI